MQPAPETPSLFDKYAFWAFCLWLYAGWFVCVLLGKYGFEFWTPVVPLIGGLLCAKAFHPARRVWLVLIASAVVGIAFDTLALHAGLIRLPDGSLLPPVWLISLWLLFTPAFLVFQKLFKRKIWRAALLGAIFGPLSYAAGNAFEVLYFNGAYAIAIYALFWAFYMPAPIILINQSGKN